MPYWYFELDRIPDLSLSKYMSLDESGVEGALNKHASFLRQLNRKGLLSRVFFHLLYSYDPKRKKGQKLQVALIAEGENEALRHTKELIQNSTVSPFYNIISLENITDFYTAVDKNGNRRAFFTNHLGINNEFIIDGSTKYSGDALSDEKSIEKLLKGDARDRWFTARISGNHILEINSDISLKDTGIKSDSVKYSTLSILYKREFFVQPSIILPDDNDLKYYKVSEWEKNDSARLYTMLKLMQGLEAPAAFRVDLFAVDYAQRLREVLPIQELRNRTSIKAAKVNSSFTVNRDDNAEETLKYYNKMIEQYECSPHFRMNIVAFANDPGISTLIVDASGAEALESGSYMIKTIKSDNNEKEFDKYHLMSRPIDLASDQVVNYLHFMPNLFTLDESMPFFVLPALYEGEVIEIPKETAPVFDSEGLKLAVDENGYDVIFPISLFKKHAFFAGVPGSGKTNTMLHLTSTLWKKFHVPFLIFEPAKQEYRALARTQGMEELFIFSPSSGTMFPLHINPFEFPKGMSLSEHIRNLMAVFEGAFSLMPPAPYMIDYAIERVYRANGWYPDTINTGDLPYPTMQELYDQLAIEVENTDYEGEIKGNLKSVLQVRIGSLLKREMGDVFDVPQSSLAPEDWLKYPALIELEAMGSGPANFLSLLLSTLIRETLKISPNTDDGALRHVIFFEEAHNLIGPVAQEVSGEDADPKTAATAFVVKMLAEVRALNEGIVIADQLPTVMAPEVIKNTGLKIGHRITAEDDRSLLGSTMSANETQLEQMATYLPGEGLITYEGLLKPFKAKVCQWEDGKASTKSPGTRELVEIRSDKVAYKYAMQRSAEIVVKKYESVFQSLAEKTIQIEELCIKWKNETKEYNSFMEKNNLTDKELISPNEPANPVISRAQTENARLMQERSTLIAKIDEINDGFEELLIKIRGCCLQNVLYRRWIRNLFKEVLRARESVFESVSIMTLYRNKVNKIQRFNKEIASWNML